jgi:hypothetical protein
VASPALVAASAFRTNVVRTTFDIAPRAFDWVGYRDALNPRNWTIRRTDGGYAPIAVRVDRLAHSTTFDVVLLSELAPDVDYDVSASAAIEAAP